MSMGEQLPHVHHEKQESVWIHLWSIQKKKSPQVSIDFSPHLFDFALEKLSLNGHGFTDHARIFDATRFRLLNTPRAFLSFVCLKHHVHFVHNRLQFHFPIPCPKLAALHNTSCPRPT